MLIKNVFVGFLLAATFTSADAMLVAQALRQLEESSHSSLRELSISTLPCLELLEVLLAASPKLTSLQVEIQSVWGSHCFSACPGWTSEPGAVKLLSDWTNVEVLSGLGLVVQTPEPVGSFSDCEVSSLTDSSSSRAPAEDARGESGRLPNRGGADHARTAASSSPHLLPPLWSTVSHGPLTGRTPQHALRYRPRSVPSCCM